MDAEDTGDAGRLFLVRLVGPGTLTLSSFQVGVLYKPVAGDVCDEARRDTGGVGGRGVPSIGTAMSAFANGSASGVRTRPRASASSSISDNELSWLSGSAYPGNTYG